MPTLIHLCHPQQVRQHFSNLAATYWSADPFKEKRTEALLSLLLLDLYNECREQQKNEENPAERAIRIISDTPHHGYTTKEMAELLFVSSKTPNNAMRKKAGKPFYAYEKQQKRNFLLK